MPEYAKTPFVVFDVFDSLYGMVDPEVLVVFSNLFFKPPTAFFKDSEIFNDIQ